MSTHHYVACDLGAESGRVILGRLEAGRLTLEEMHRFANGPVRLGGSLRWDLLRIWEEIKIGLRKVLARGVSVESVSVDSWGLDYVLSGAGEPLLGVPHHYRDPRTDAPFAATASAEDRELIFTETGIQRMSFNTLYQLMADARSAPRLLEVAECFLNIADFVHFLLGGVACAEESLASTTQLYNPRTRKWSGRLLERFGLPGRIFPAIVPSGTVLGPLAPALVEELRGGAEWKVVASCSHDTGAAVAAVPVQGEAPWAYLSSGTWSLLGVELDAPRIEGAVAALNFTNEAGYGGTTRLLKNLAGLWILQEARREWAERGEVFEYEELSKLAAAASPFGPLIQPADPRFVRPGAMLQKIDAYCAETGQAPPGGVGAYVRCIFESLALLYRRTLEEVESLTGVRAQRLHVVGGGSQSALLNQCAADASGVEVVAGPVEATAAGNLLIQALALGHLDSLQHLRRTVRDSFEMRSYVPSGDARWKAAYERFRALPAS